MLDYQLQFIEFALECDVLKFGEFQLKSGRISPYFFNAGLFNSGAKLDRLGGFYAQALLDSGLNIDVLYGPAYKGIPLAAATAIAYAKLNQDVAYAFNRKEAKLHGEGGALIGAPLKGKVLIVDDVITQGSSVRESVAVITAAGAKPAGVLIALDRREKGLHELSAVQEVEQEIGVPVIAIITFADIIEFVEMSGDQHEMLRFIHTYRLEYGI
jgi:orotate phosphoribosyltransferase